MYFKPLIAAALLLTSAFATPFSITIDIEDGALTPSVNHDVAGPHRHEQPVLTAGGKDVEYVKKYLGFHQKASGLALEHVSKLRGNRIYGMAEIMGDVYKQYTLFNASIDYIPEDEFSEEDARVVTDNFYDLAQSLQAQFETVVEQKNILIGYPVLIDYLLGLVYFMDESYDDYNDKLYALLPTDAFKSEWTDYSAPAATAIEDAKEALNVIVVAGSKAIPPPFSLQLE